MIEGLILFITCAMETALCIYYYDSFMQYKSSKLHKLIAYFTLTVFVVGNAALFEVVPSKYYSIKLLTYIFIHIIFVKICYRSGWITSTFFSGSAVLLQILVQTLVYLSFHFSHSDNQIFVNLMACLACAISLCIEVFLRKKLPLLKE